MNPAEVVFILLSAVVIASAALAVGSRQLVHAALWLVVTLGGVAGCFILMTAELLASGCRCSTTSARSSCSSCSR